MKKILSIGVLLTVLSFLGISKSFALTFDQAFSQVGKKPMVVLIYANWADGYENCLHQFRTVKASLGGVYNFVELDIAQKDAKYFNDRFQIYPKLPYIMMFRDGGKISRYLPRDCASSASCTASRLKSFVH